MKWSPQQLAFINWAHTGKGSCVLEAVAGAGKTTTLLAAARKMRGEVAILAYNRAIAAEIKEKIKGQDDMGHVIAGTVHSFGVRAYRRQHKHAEVDRNKLDRFTDSTTVKKIVSLAKQRAIGVVGSIEDASLFRDIIEHFDLMEDADDDEVIHATILQAQQVLRASNRVLDVIDFDDMVYLPLLLKLPFWRYDAVMVDEAQDTNPARRALVRALTKPNGRVVAVGDRHQAIYGFTGADNDSLDLIAQDFDAQYLPLTTTYRCPKQVVAFAQQWVSHIIAADTAPEGEVAQSDVAAFIERARTDGTLSTAAILCRNTKPLVELALTLIRHRIACKVEGRDIGAQLVKLVNKWKVKNLDALADRLDKYKEQQTTKLLARKQEHKVQVLEDTVETIKVIIEQCQKEGKNTRQHMADYIADLFADDVKGLLTLSTIHKSKGREWEEVFWLDRHGTCPSKWARQPWQKDQEVNLMYVAATRAKHRLIELAPATRAPAPTPEQTNAQIATVLSDDRSRPVELDEKAEIDARFERGEITKEERAKLHKARRARERKQRV